MGRSFFINELKYQQTSLHQKTHKKKKKKKNNEMKLRPNIYFVPWPSSSFSFSASFVASPLAEGCDAKVATSVEEGTLSKGGISFMVVEVVWVFLWDLGGQSLTRVG